MRGANALKCVKMHENERFIARVVARVSCFHLSQPAPSAFLEPIATATRAINCCTGRFGTAAMTDEWHEGGPVVVSPPCWNARFTLERGMMGRQCAIQPPFFSSFSSSGGLFLPAYSSRSSSHHAINQGNTRVPEWEGGGMGGKSECRKAQIATRKRSMRRDLAR